MSILRASSWHVLPYKCMWFDRSSSCCNDLSSLSLFKIIFIDEVAFIIIPSYDYSLSFFFNRGKLLINLFCWMRLLCEIRLRFYYIMLCDKLWMAWIWESWICHSRGCEGSLKSRSWLIGFKKSVALGIVVLSFMEWVHFGRWSLRGRATICCLATEPTHHRLFNCFTSLNGALISMAAWKSRR